MRTDPFQRSIRRNSGTVLLVASVVAVVWVLVSSPPEPPTPFDNVAFEIRQLHNQAFRMGAAIHADEFREWFRPWLHHAHSFGVMIIGANSTAEARVYAASEPRAAVISLLDLERRAVTPFREYHQRGYVWNHVVGPHLQEQELPWLPISQMALYPTIHEAQVVLNVWGILPSRWAQSEEGSVERLSLCRFLGRLVLLSKLTLLGFGCAVDDAPEACDPNHLLHVMNHCIKYPGEHSLTTGDTQQGVELKVVRPSSVWEDNDEPSASTSTVIAAIATDIHRDILIHHRSCLEKWFRGTLGEIRLCDRTYRLNYSNPMGSAEPSQVAHPSSHHGALPLANVLVRGTWIPMDALGFNVGMLNELDMLSDLWTRVSLWLRVLTLPLGEDSRARNAVLVNNGEVRWIDREQLGSLDEYRALTARFHHLLGLVASRTSHSSVAEESSEAMNGARLAKGLFSLLWGVRHISDQHDALVEALTDPDATSYWLSQFLTPRADLRRQPWMRALWFAALMELVPHASCGASLEDLEVYPPPSVSPQGPPPLPRAIPKMVKGAMLPKLVWKSPGRVGRACRERGAAAAYNGRANLHDFFHCGYRLNITLAQGPPPMHRVRPMECILQKVLLPSPYSLPTWLE